MPEYKVVRYESLPRLIEQADAWNAEHKRKLTTFVKKFEDGAYAISCGNMGWRGPLDKAEATKFETWLKDQDAIKVVGVSTQEDLFAD